MKKLKIGVVGLGRMGMEYVHIIQNKIPNAELLAVCSIVDKELQQVKYQYKIPNIYQDYSKMLTLDDLECVFIISSTDQHADQMIAALKAGKHVFCEKPLAIDLDICREVSIVANEYHHLKSQVGFVRRFDQSYLYAKQKVEEGAIGMPYLVKSQTVDKDAVASFQFKYVEKSGGIFHDYNVHDIDLARWFLGSEISQVHAIGGAFKYPQFAESGDADHVMTTCQFENGTMAVINASRMASHGHDTFTEIVGTEGSLRIGRPASRNRVEIYDKHGSRQEWVNTFWERFEDAFASMTQDFVNCVLTNRQPLLSLDDAIKATEAARAFTKSFKTGEIVKLS